MYLLMHVPYFLVPLLALGSIKILSTKSVLVRFLVLLKCIFFMYLVLSKFLVVFCVNFAIAVLFCASFNIEKIFNILANKIKYQGKFL